MVSDKKRLVGDHWGRSKIIPLGGSHPCDLSYDVIPFVFDVLFRVERALDHV